MKTLLCLPLLAMSLSCTGAPPTLAGGFEEKRKRMVDQQLARRGIEDSRVLKAMQDVPRHEFVPEDQQGWAYADSPLPIGHDQTISQPYIVAFMTEQLDPQPGDRVLEIGTGSGYQAAVLGELVDHVYTIEIVRPLAERASKTLGRLGYKNVTVKAGDGYQGWPEHAPFDAVIVTAAPEDVPQPLVDQLKEGGKMIIPVGKVGGVQELRLLRKSGGKIEQEAMMPVRFVPMTGESRR
ncbi:protein-L-isoaspartate(D-aspartate) O-methyltransferase [soil metagenome]